MEDDTRISIPIYLLKTASTPTDNYATILSEPSSSSSPAPTRYEFKPQFIPVLEHRFVDESLAKLQTLISQGSFNNESTSLTSPSANPIPIDRTNQQDTKEKYQGIIFTSQRAVDAFASTISTLRASSSTQPADAKFPDQKSPDINTFLPATTTLYAVGPATARSLRALNLQCRVAGEESGNGDALAQFILHDLLTNPTPSRDSKQKVKLLFLVGETRRDIIPRTLSDDGIAVDEVVVYATTEAESFAGTFNSALENRDADEHEHVKLGNKRVKWVVVFSPQGSTALLRVLNILDPTTNRAFTGKRTSQDRLRLALTGTASTETASDESTGQGKPIGQVLVASIGPTTQAHLQSNFDFEVDVCAKQPTPAGVRDGIAEFMERHSIFSS